MPDEREHGRVVSVSTRTLGSTLEGDTAAGATSLVVFDAADFNATGGTLSINGSQLAYSTYDDDAATITLTDPLPAAASDGDFVACWDILYDAAGTEKTAMVQLDGDDDNPDPIECYVPHFLADKLDDGDRGGPGESVVIEYDEDEDEWTVRDVRGLAGASGAGVKFEADDTYTLTAADITAGTVTFSLSQKPVDESLTAWCGIPQPPTEFTINYTAPSITFPLAGFEAAGAELWVHYAYRDSAITPFQGAVLDWQSTGWKYLQVPLSDTTDRSAPTFDDSTWSTGAAPFGNGSGSGWPPAVTAWASQNRMWFRRQLTVPAGVSALDLSYRVDNYLDVYVDGSLVFSVGGDQFVKEAIAVKRIPVGPGQHTLAVRASDDATAYGGDGTYADLQLATTGSASA